MTNRGQRGKIRVSNQAADFLRVLEKRKHYLGKIIRDHLPSDKTAAINELGCGCGALLYLAQQDGYVNMAGCDMNRHCVRISREVGIKNVTHADLFDVVQNLPDQSQAALVTFDVIEHLTRDQLSVLVSEIYRSLQSDGIWIIHTINAGSPFFGRVMYGDPTHQLAFTPASLRQHLLTAGFRDIICREETPCPYGVKSLIRFLGWRIIRLLLTFYLVIETGDLQKDAIFSQNFLAVASK